LGHIRDKIKLDRIAGREADMLISLHKQAITTPLRLQTTLTPAPEAIREFRNPGASCSGP